MSDSIISSLIASAIWGLLVVFFSPKIIKFLKKMIVSLMDSGSLFVFNSYNDEEFIKDFKHEMKKAETFGNLYKPRQFSDGSAI